MADDKKPGGFWTSLPGILTGVAAVIAAVGGLVAGLHQWSGGDDQSSTSTGDSGAPVSESPGLPSAPDESPASPSSTSKNFNVEKVFVMEPTPGESDEPIGCPATVTWSGLITVKGKGTVSYVWYGDDGTEDAPKSVRFNESGTERVRTTSRVSAPSGQPREAGVDLAVVSTRGDPPGAYHHPFKFTCR